MAAKIKDGLFLGDYETAQDLDFILANKITHIICCAGRELANCWERSGVKYLTYYWPENGNCIVFDEANADYFTDKEAATILKIYEQTRSISIDYGIMEKAENVFVIPSEFGWSDLGTWTSLYEISDKDTNLNVSNGKNIHLYQSSGCMVNTAQLTGDKIVVLNSVKDLIVVDTPDVLLICDKSKEQEVKEVATDMKIKFNEKYS